MNFVALLLEESSSTCDIVPILACQQFWNVLNDNSVWLEDGSHSGEVKK
jgi:hypothetical protein